MGNCESSYIIMCVIFDFMQRSRSNYVRKKMITQTENQAFTAANMFSDSNFTVTDILNILK